MNLRLIPVARLYETEQKAGDAVTKLVDKGFDEDSISLITPAEGVESEPLAQVAAAINDAHAPSEVPPEHAVVYARGLQKGQSLVLVTAQFGKGLAASEALKSAGPVQGPSVPPPAPKPLGPTPLSDYFGLQVLSEGHSRFASLWGGLLSDKFPIARFFGLDLLSENNPTPLSSAIGMKALSENQGRGDTSFGVKLLSDNPTPLSSSGIGRTVAAVSGAKSAEGEEGLPLLIDNPMPMSTSFIGRWVAGLLGVRRKVNDAGETESSFGLPLLIDSPTPLSSYLGLPVLSRKR